MKRPAGVVVSAIVLILGSVFELLMAAGMAFAGALFHRHTVAGTLPASANTPTAPWMPIFFYGFAAFMVLLTLWGIVTAVGVLRLRRWARYSILVIGGGLALFGTISAASTLLLLFLPLPLSPATDPSQAQSLHFAARATFAGVAFFYVLMAAIGVWWLVYFNRKAARDLFSGAQPESAIASSRPFLITLFAILNGIGAAGCLMMIFVPVPAAVFGALVHGWPKAALYATIAVLDLAVAIGLWRLREWARRLAFAMLGLGFAQCLFNLFRPSLMIKYSQEVSRTWVPVQPQMEPYSTAIFSFSSILSILLIAAICIVLVKYRRAFSPPPPAAL